MFRILMRLFDRINYEKHYDCQEKDGACKLIASRLGEISETLKPAPPVARLNGIKENTHYREEYYDHEDDFPAPLQVNWILFLLVERAYQHEE